MSKRVLIMNTGGTLASVAREHGLTPGLTTESMERELHILAGEAQLTMQEFSSLDSANIFPKDWAPVVKAVGFCAVITLVLLARRLSRRPAAEPVEEEKKPQTSLDDGRVKLSTPVSEILQNQHRTPPKVQTLRPKALEKKQP